MLTVRGILHPTDFSDLSDNAFRLACCMAQDYQAPLHVLHVATSFEAYKSELVFKKRSEQYLAKDWEKLLAWGVDGITTDYSNQLAEWLNKGDRRQETGDRN